MRCGWCRRIIAPARRLSKDASRTHPSGHEDACSIVGGLDVRIVDLRAAAGTSTTPPDPTGGVAAAVAGVLLAVEEGGGWRVRTTVTAIVQEYASRTPKAELTDSKALKIASRCHLRVD